MKKLILTLSAIFIFAAAFAQLDRSQRPEPGPAPRIEIGDAKSFTLDNGLRVFVVENTKIPRVAISMVFDYDPVYEGPFAGMVDITGQMLRTATATRSKEVIDDEIDFIGASLSTSATGLFASGLSRHSETLAELISDIIINARFEEVHFNRIKTQALSGLSAAKNDPSSIAARVNKVLLYGADHPYGLNTTEASLENITLDMCREFYNTFFKPNITYMVVVGDVEFNEVKKTLEKHFSPWQSGDVPQMKYSPPRPPAGNRVAMVDRPNAVQSTIRVGFPVDLQPGADDAIAARVMNLILGGSTSRLFDNLRETHGFTYGAYSRLSTDRLAGSFTAFTDVRNIATDSAVHEILFEIGRMRNELVPERELQLYKNELNGNFALSLEDPQTVARFALNIARYDLPADYYASYLQKLANVSQQDIMDAARKHLHPANANILVVGKAADVAENLKRFAADGRILYFDEDGLEYDPDQKLKPAPAGMTAADVTAKYIQAIGGEKKLGGMKDLSITMMTEMQGMTLNFETYRKAPDKFKMVIGSGGTVFSEQIFDGEKGVATSPAGREELTGENLEQMKMQAVMNPELYYDKHNINQELLGIERIGGEEAYKLQLTFPSGKTDIHYYDVNTGLKIRTITEGGTADFSDYREVDGIKFPFAIRQAMGPQMLDLKVLSVEVNSKLKDELFKID